MQPTAFLSAAVLALICGTHASAHAAPETCAIDSGHTFPRFSYNHMGLSKQLSTVIKRSDFHAAK